MSLPAASLGVLAAASFAVGSVLTKGMVDRFPPRQLIGPLYAFNALLMVPFAPFVDWRWNGSIVLLHGLSVIAISLTALAVFAMFSAGAASATTTAQAMSPVPAAILSMFLLPKTVDGIQLMVALGVVAAVLWALSDAFPRLGRRGTLVIALASAVGGGSATVIARLLADSGSGVVQTYVVRTGIAAVLFLLFVPPRSLRPSQFPAMFIRALFITIGFGLAIFAVQDGSPTVVQTGMSTTPLLVLAWEKRDQGVAISRRTLVGAVLAMLGVALMAGT